MTAHRAGALARDTAWMTLSYGARLLIQAAYFLVLARTLGADDYGTFVGLAATVGVLTPLASLGVGHILVREAARQPSTLSSHLGDALTVATIGAAAIGAVLLLLRKQFLPETIPLGLLATVLASDLVGAQLSEICAQAFQASSRIRYSAALHLAPVVLRLIAAIAVEALFAVPSIEHWLLAYGLAGIASAAIALSVALLAVRPCTPNLRRAVRQTRDGWKFSVMASTQFANNDADKALLARIGPPEAAGAYSAAYRLVDVAFSPVRSLMYAAYAKTFSVGATGVRDSYAFGLRLASWSGLYSMIVAALLWIGAPIVPELLGDTFAESVAVLRWLAPLLPARALQVTAADALAGAGKYSLRMWTTLVVAGLNIALNVALIPTFSWRASALISVCADLTLAMLFWSALLVHASQRRATAKAD